MTENITPFYSPNQYTEMVITVRHILKAKHNIDIPDACHQFLVRCIRLKDENAEKSVKLILATRKQIQRFESWDAKLQPSIYSPLFDSGVLTLLSSPDPEGHPIFLLRAYRWNPEQFNFDQLVMSIWLLAQCVNAQNLRDVQKNGYVVVMDFSGFTMAQAWAIKHWKLVRMATWIQNGVNGRLKRFHGINAPSVINFLYNGVKPFLSQKIRDRIHFHGSLDQFHKHIEPSRLPRDLGGEQDEEESVDQEFIQTLVNSDKFFADMAYNGFPSK